MINYYLCFVVWGTLGFGSRFSKVIPGLEPFMSWYRGAVENLVEIGPEGHRWVHSFISTNSLFYE